MHYTHLNFHQRSPPGAREWLGGAVNEEILYFLKATFVISDLEKTITVIRALISILPCFMDAAACLIRFKDFTIHRALQRTNAREQLKNSSIQLLHVRFVFHIRITRTCNFNMYDFHLRLLSVYIKYIVNRM